MSSCDDLIEVDTTRNLATERILAVPNDIVTTRFLGLVDQRSDLLSQYVVNHEVNVLRPTEHVSNRRRRIERVRIVLTQSKSLDLGLDKVLFRHNQSPLRQQRNIDIHVPGEIRRKDHVTSQCNLPTQQPTFHHSIPGYVDLRGRCINSAYELDTSSKVARGTVALLPLSLRGGDVEENVGGAPTVHGYGRALAQGQPFADVGRHGPTIEVENERRFLGKVEFLEVVNAAVERNR